MPVDKLKQYVARGEYLRARREADRLIQTGDLAGADLIQVYRVAAYAHYYLQDVYGAAKLCERALDLAVEQGNAELTGRCRYDLGEIYLALGDLHLAREHLVQFLSGIDQYPALQPLEGKAHHNLALIFRQRREYDNALAAHHLAASLFQRDGNLRQMIEAIRGVIWCHLTMDEPQAAWPCIQQVSAYLQTHQDDRLTASLLTDLAYYYRLVGDTKRSMDFCEEALVPGRPGIDDHILATACAIAGENALDVQQYQEAGMFANLALDYALKARHPLLMNRATSLKRRIKEKDPSKAAE